MGGHAFEQVCVQHVSQLGPLPAYRQFSKDKSILQLVMVTTNGVAHNSYYNMIQKEITMDDLFV